MLQVSSRLDLESALTPEFFASVVYSESVRALAAGELTRILPVAVRYGSIVDRSLSTYGSLIDRLRGVVAVGGDATRIVPWLDTVSPLRNPRLYVISRPFF